MGLLRFEMFYCYSNCPPAQRGLSYPKSTKPSYVLHKDLVALNTVSNKIRFIILLLRGKDVLA